MKQRNVILILSSIIALLVIYAGMREYASYRGAEAGKDDLIKILKEENDFLKRERDSQDRTIMDTSETNKASASNNEAEDRVISDEAIDSITTINIDKQSQEYLKSIGIDDISVVENDLKAKGSEIIQTKEVSESVQFTNVELINYKWVLGYFSDGIIEGYGIYEFNVLENGDLNWRVISEKKKDF